jgi:hypothetical protein
LKGIIIGDIYDDIVFIISPGLDKKPKILEKKDDIESQEFLIPVHI